MTARASFFAYIFSRKQRYVPRRCSVPRGRAALCATAAALCAAGGRAALCCSRRARPRHPTVCPRGGRVHTTLTKMGMLLVAPVLDGVNV